MSRAPRTGITETVDLDKGWKRIKREFIQLNGDVEAGLTSDTPRDIVMRGVYNEFGTRNIPPRPFVRHTADKNRKAINILFESAMRAMIKGRIDAHHVLDNTGWKMADLIKNAVIGWKQPPNAPSTIAQKGFNDPLIHSGDMRDAISYKVVNAKTGKRI